MSVTSDKSGTMPKEGGESDRDYMNVLIYGESGAGKSHLAGTATLVPEMCPVVYLDVEDGSMTIRQNFDQSKVEIRSIEKWKDIEKQVRKVRDGEQFATVVLDNATEAQNFDFAEMLGENLDSIDDDSQPAWGDYSISLNHMTKMARSLRRTKMHVIVTAWAKEEVNAKGELSKISVQLSNKVAKQFPGHFDSCFYLYTERRKGRTCRTLLTEDGALAQARTRVRGMPEKIEDPTMQKVFDYTFGKSNGSENERNEHANQHE